MNYHVVKNLYNNLSYFVITYMDFFSFLKKKCFFKSKIINLDNWYLLNIITYNKFKFILDV